jgi:alpha-L-fucosidase 2
MQMDGGMGAVAAVQEMLLHTRRGVNHLFAGAPARWETVQFDDMLTDGAFLVSARREGGVVQWVKVKSQTGGVFRLRNPWDGAGVGTSDRQKTTVEGLVLKIETEVGEKLVLQKAK